MNSFNLALSTVFPLIIYMLVGQFIRHYKILSPESLKDVNGMIFKILIATSLFNDIRKASFSDVDKPWVFIYVVTAILIVYLVSWITVSRIVKNNMDSSVMIQAIYRSNHVLFGSMIAANLCTPEGRPIAASMIAVVVPIYNILVVVLFELKLKGKVKIDKLIANIFKNPLIRASIAGLIVNFLGNPIPEILNIPIEKIAATASPIALIILGAMLSIDGFKRHIKYLTAVVLSRLVVVPVIVIGIGIFLGLRGDYVVILISVFASPVAASSVATAQSMEANGELAAEAVALTTIMSVFTIFAIVYGLLNIGII